MIHIDNLGRKTIRSKYGTLTLRPKKEYLIRDKPLYIPQDCRVHFSYNLELEDGQTAPTNSTTRSLDKYHPEVKKEINNLDITSRVIEVGAGLGELIPTITTNFSRKSADYNKPVVIDPLNYNAFLEMVKEMRQGNISQEEDKLLDRVEYFAEIITDRNKVNLINTTLGQAIKNNPGLIGSADMVVDNWGAIAYSDTEERKDFCVFGNIFRVKCIEEKLLNETGRIYTRGTDARIIHAYRMSQLRD